MLILERRPGEKILFPELGIEICLLGVNGRQSRIGINAPKEVTILREEVYLRELENNKAIKG